MATQPKSNTVTLHFLAAQSYREYDGNIAAAKASLLQKLSTDKKLLASIIDDALSNSISYLMHKAAGFQVGSMADK